MSVAHVARQVKHAAFVAQKRTRRSYRRQKFEVATRVFRDIDGRRPFEYQPGRYKGSFIVKATAPLRSDSAFPRRAFVVWTGDNPLTDNRKRNLDVIQERLGLPVHVVTSRSLGDWMVEGHPLHVAYPHLSLIHRSDYLRAYLMHHHGGAYLDIKEPLHSWGPSYDDMAADPERWVTSYRTTDANWIGKTRGLLGLDILVRYQLMFGKSGFMMRSHTPITSEWLSEIDHRLDIAMPELVKNPGDVRGANVGYPLSWTDLLARVLDPLTLKYTDHVGYDERMLLRFTDYQ